MQIVLKCKKRDLLGKMTFHISNAPVKGRMRVNRIFKKTEIALVRRRWGESYELFGRWDKDINVIEGCVSNQCTDKSKKS